MIAPWEIPLIVFYLALSLWLIRKSAWFKLDGIHPDFISVVFILKVLAGTFLAAIYLYYYTDRSTADIYKYFDDSKLMSDALYNRPADFFKMLFGIDNDTSYFSEQYYNHMNNWFRKYESNIYNDSHTIIRINAVMRIFSFGSYHVHTIFVSLFSLIGLTALYKSCIQFAKGKEQLMAAALFLLPSVVFWGSGVLKESFLLFGLGIFFYGFMTFVSHRKLNLNLVVVVGIGLLLLLYLKVYVLMALLPGLCAYAWVEWRKPKLVLFHYLFVIIMMVICAVGFEYVFPNYHMLEIFVQKQQDFIRLAQEMESGSQIQLMPLSNSPWSFLAASPLAFCNVFFRPFIGESFSPFILMAELENLIFVLGILFIVLRFNRPNASQRNFIYLATTFVILLFVLIGWVTPVMGAIVRYKVPALPFLAAVYVILYKTKYAKQQKRD